MRILALGCSLPDPQVDHFDWASSHSFYDYDAIVIDPVQAVSKFIEGIMRDGAAFQTYDQVPIGQGPTNAMAIGLADLLRRRREETERLLARGGVVVVYGAPDAPHSGVPGFDGASRYYWLPAPQGADYGAAYVKHASGRQVQPTDYEHPFAAFLEDQRANVLYRASFVEGADGFGNDAKVIGRSNGGAAIAMELKVGGGKIIFIPALSSMSVYESMAPIATQIVGAVRNTLLQDAEDAPPGWLDQYELPGVAEARKKMTAAEAKLDESESDFDEARNAYRAIDRYRRVLWQEGKFGYDLPVRDALVLLGLESTAGIDEPASFRRGMETIYVEAQSSAEKIGMEPHYRLRQRLESQIAKYGERVRGVIVVNGYRRYEPKDRQPEVEDSLRVAAESMRYCVLPARYLFDALRDKLEGKGDADAFLDRVLASEGLFAPEEKETPPAEDYVEREAEAAADVAETSEEEAPAKKK